MPLELLVSIAETGFSGVTVGIWLSVAVYDGIPISVR